MQTLARRRARVRRSVGPAPLGVGVTPRPGARVSRWLVGVLYLLLLLGFGAGIWGSYRALHPARGLHRVSGVLEARVSETSILVRHEAVPGLMEAMPSMAFTAESREIIDRAALAPGDRVRLTVRGRSDALVVVDIQKIP